MDRKRSIAYGTIVLGLVLGSGQWLSPRQAETATIVLPPPQDLTQAPAAGPAPAPVLAMTQPDAPPPVAAAQPAVPAEQISHIVPVAAVADPLEPAETAPQADMAEADACQPVLDLIAEPDAMIGVTLVAPCQSGARIVLSHGGLTVTAQATATGSVFTSLPALDAAGEVSVLFPDGSRHSAALPMPEVADVKRFAVQWLDEDRLTLNAQVDGEDASNLATHMTLANLPAGDSVSGKVITVGDASVALPMLAQVYTYPADASPALSVEAQVTPTTCGRDLLGETLESAGGRVAVRDLTLPMPGCDALGQFLVLNIPAPDLTLALAE